MPAGKFDHLLHPLVRYERVELAPEKNALASWQAAVEAVVDPDELGNLSSLFDPDCGCEEAACLVCYPPAQDELLRRLREVLAKNAAVRSHFERGLELGRLQVRLDPPRDFEGGLSVTRLRSLARLNLCEGHLASLEGDPLRAATWYAKNVKFGRMLADCDGSIVVFLVARAVQGTGLHALLRLAESGPVSQELRAVLRDARAQEIDAKLAAQVQRSELAEFNWPMLKSLAESPEDSVLARAAELFFPEPPAEEPEPDGGAQRVAEFFFPEPPAEEPDADDPLPEMTRGAARFAEFESRARAMLFEGHPDLWDAEETLRVVSLITAGQIAELVDDEVSRQEIESELSSWKARAEAYHELQPKELSPLGSFLAYLENWKPPSDRKLRKIRDKLRALRNPLGIMVAGMTTGVGGRALLVRAPEDDSESRWERVLS